MAGFTNKLTVEFTQTNAEDYDKARAIVLIDDLRYIAADGTEYVVPKGFFCDGASIPYWLRVFAPRWNYITYQGVLHDYLLRSGIVDETTADKLFYEALRAGGISWYSAWKLYLGVRIGTRIRQLERLFGICWLIRDCNEKT